MSTDWASVKVALMSRTSYAQLCGQPACLRYSMLNAQRNRTGMTYVFFSTFCICSRWEKKKFGIFSPRKQARNFNESQPIHSFIVRYQKMQRSILVFAAEIECWTFSHRLKYTLRFYFDYQLVWRLLCRVSRTSRNASL